MILPYAAQPLAQCAPFDFLVHGFWDSQRMPQKSSQRSFTRCTSFWNE
jgi:hypothetical protein